LSAAAAFPSTLTSPVSGSTSFGSSLMPQLRVVAQMIDAGQRAAASGGLGMQRQIFFVQVGGYDTHYNQFTTSSMLGAHNNLLAELSQGIKKFQDMMDTLGFTNKVVTFTASDFGRTLQANGQGSDHGWGSHHFIVGGPVLGQKTYGLWPSNVLGGNDDTGTGRWIPSTSVDQYTARLATWFGVPSGDLATIFPNLGRFGAPPAFL
jgi:uncharacterized protein (DUF1501 family)